MSRFLRSIPPRRSRDFPILGFAVALILLCPLGVAQASDEMDRPDSSRASTDRERIRGRASFELPMELRARFESNYTDARYVSDRLARPYVTAGGPNLQNDHSLVSQVALTRVISDNIEIEIVWSTRSRLTNINLFDFDRQTIGAVIRLVP
jgi:hypothetical protein